MISLSMMINKINKIMKIILKNNKKNNMIK